MRVAIATIAILVPFAARAEAPPPCPTAPGVVERTVGASTTYLGAAPGDPEACRIVRDGIEGLYYYGSWKTDWPGAEPARLALRQVYAGGPGTAVRFDTVAAPGYSWHETIRNDGFENLNVAGAVHRTMKVAHEREGFGGNTYHSVIVSWKDVATNMTIYQNYIHISGHPEPGAAWDPTAIKGGR